MKRVAAAGIVLAVSLFFAAQAWAHGMGGFGMGGHVGGFHGGSGHFGHPGVSHFPGGTGHFGGFQGSFGHPGPHLGFGSPQFHRPGFGHFDHSQHEQFFGPHHHFGPFVPFGHEQHFGHEQFSGLHHHCGGCGFGFRSFGFSGRSFFFGHRFGPAGPPPLGAPGPTPFGSANPPVVVISSPFFCFPHGLGFTDQAVFVDHLHQLHRVPPRSALSFCWPVGGGSRLIFFGF